MIRSWERTTHVVEICDEDEIEYRSSSSAENGREGLANLPCTLGSCPDHSFGHPRDIVGHLALTQLERDPIPAREPRRPLAHRFSTKTTSAVVMNFAKREGLRGVAMFLAGQSGPKRKPRTSTGPRTLLKAPYRDSISGRRFCFLSDEFCYFQTLCRLPHLVEFFGLSESVLYLVH